MPLESSSAFSPTLRHLSSELFQAEPHPEPSKQAQPAPTRHQPVTFRSIYGLKGTRRSGPSRGRSSPHDARIASDENQTRSLQTDSLHKAIVDAVMGLKVFSNLLCDKVHRAKEHRAPAPRPGMASTREPKFLTSSRFPPVTQETPKSCKKWRTAEIMRP
jgi:hypothetical protein